jgi:hypothetical protein
MTTKTTIKPQPEDTSSNGSRFDAFLSKLGPKDKTNIERHLAACETESTPEHVKLWKRLAGSLYALAGHAVQTSGQRAVRFYVQDGKYRFQAFALEDARDHTLVVYATDVLDRALKSGLLTGPVETDGTSQIYSIGGDRTAKLRVEQIESATNDAPEYYRHMLGWNRKAMKITLSISASPAQIRAAEALCALAAPAGA